MTTKEESSISTPSSSSIKALLGFVPGAVGGVCNVLVGHPIDLVKVRIQTMTNTTATTAAAVKAASSPQLIMTRTTTTASPSTLGMLRQIAGSEGLPGLYAGVAAPLLAVVPAFAISFWSFEMAATFQKSYWNSSTAISKNTTNQQSSSSSPHADLTLTQVALAGAFSGVPLAMVLGPLERIKCLMQVDRTGRYTSFAHCVQQVLAQGGLASLFRGTALTVLRDVPGNAAYFWGYHATKRTLMQQQPQSYASSSYNYYYTLAVTLFAGGMAGMANWVVAIPFDVVKSRWQTAAPGTYRSVGHVVRDLLEQQGPRALFRGLGPALIRAFPANAACLWGVETAQQLMDQVFKLD